MVKLNRLVCIVSCLLILSACASNLGRNVQSSDDGFLAAEREAKILYQLGREYQDKKNYSDAILRYEEALALDPGNFEIYNAMGVVYSILAEHELAIQLIKEAIHLKPMMSSLHNNLGFAYLRQGHASEAAGAFQRALQLDPENQHARRNLATAYKEMGCTENEPCGQWQEPNNP